MVLLTGVVAEIKIPFNSMGSMSKWVWCNKNLVICLSSIFELARICGSQQLLSIVSWCLFAKRVVALVFSIRPQHSPKNVVIALCCIVAVLCPGVVCSVEQKFHEGPQGLQQLVHIFSQNAGVGAQMGWTVYQLLEVSVQVFWNWLI